ncbi:hypothetical protein Bhyg_05974 [Pseudolycoriella hygida]|uniref:Uncharacterized protein n=1 Tax=Pseudolycoriella hygida TaxID=35572 RepID=A0A9Q0N0L3_9DIPT|nr:hypothetical protein Bhyg_05974 [Pseudolycoriella hygida]
MEFNPMVNLDDLIVKIVPKRKTEVKQCNINLAYPSYNKYNDYSLKFACLIFLVTVTIFKVIIHMNVNHDFDVEDDLNGLNEHNGQDLNKKFQVEDENEILIMSNYLGQT